jgi:hypothetical protein
MANHLPDEFTLMLNKNADLIEQVWAMPLGLRISTLILSVVQAHSKDIGKNNRHLLPNQFCTV